MKHANTQKLNHRWKNWIKHILLSHLCPLVHVENLHPIPKNIRNTIIIADANIPPPPKKNTPFKNLKIEVSSGNFYLLDTLNFFRELHKHSRTRLYRIRDITNPLNMERFFISLDLIGLENIRIQ